MPPAWKEVFSSNVNRVAHDPDTGELMVEWNSGKTSVYSDVPADLADQVSTAWSVGGAIRTHIIGQYSHRYV